MAIIHFTVLPTTVTDKKYSSFFYYNYFKYGGSATTAKLKNKSSV